MAKEIRDVRLGRIQREEELYALNELDEETVAKFRLGILAHEEGHTPAGQTIILIDVYEKLSDEAKNLVVGEEAGLGEKLKNTAVNVSVAAMDVMTKTVLMVLNPTGNRHDV